MILIFLFVPQRKPPGPWSRCWWWWSWSSSSAALFPSTGPSRRDTITGRTRRMTPGHKPETELIFKIIHNRWDNDQFQFSPTSPRLERSASNSNYNRLIEPFDWSFIFFCVLIKSFQVECLQRRGEQRNDQYLECEQHFQKPEPAPKVYSKQWNES